MDEHGMENEHLEHRNSSNTEYLPTKCRVTKPPPPKPATNPLQFIKVAPPPLFQKAKEQVSKVEKIKKERKEVQDEAEDWQANLDNWKSSRRKLQEHIIERVVEVKKLEHEETGRNRRRSKTFNEILEERGKSKYSIPIYMDETNDWSDYGISDSKGDRNVDVRNGDQNGLGAGDQFSNEKFSTKTNDYSMAGEYGSNVLKQEAKLNNNDYNQDSVLKNGQYTYEGAIEGYRSRIKSKIDDSILGKISDIPKQNAEVDVLVPRGEIEKRKELFDRQLSTEGNHVSGGAAKRLQDFENSISIKQRLKSLERCNDQTVKLVDNINIVPKVKQISQLFDKPCTDNARPYSSEVGQNTNSEYAERREKVNINIVPWTERETVSESPEIFMYMDKHDAKENESHSDDKSSDTFYSGLEDNNYPPSIASTDYMALSSDREDSGIHTADVSCSVSQADDTAEELESNANSHETTNDEYHPQKYFKDTEDNNNVYGDHILMLTKENVTNRTNIELQEDDVNSLYNSSTVSSFPKENIFDSTVKFLDVEKMDSAESLEPPIHHAAREAKEYREEQIADTTETSPEPTRLPEIREEIVKSSDANKTIVPEVQTVSSLGLFRVADPFPVELAGTDYVFDSDFPLLPTKMVEPPKVKPPPPPVVVDDDKPLDANMRRINSTKRIKNEITLKRSSFLGLSEPNDVCNDATEEVLITSPDEEYSKVEEILAKQLYDSKMSDYCVVENLKSELIVEVGESNRNWSSTPDEKIEKEVTNSSPPDEDEIAKREREIIEMVEKAEKFREPEIVAEDLLPLVQVPKPPVPLSRTSVPSTCTRKSADASYYDKEAELRRLQDQKSYSSWQQQPKYATDAALPSLLQRGPITAPHSSSITSVRKLTGVNTDLQPFMEHHHGPSGPPPSVTQPRSVAVEDGPNRILSVSGKKKCSFCGNELGRGAAMIIETLCLFYHMECFKCCVCHVQLGNGLNGTDVRVRNEKLHCHNCYSSDDGVKFSCV
ncbi:hypothetical protein WA026_008984 [Henosepilachna vigintioctopunctata]|uniref:LIM zinc-binding domain-containing protein n=1 Tax=Henosepilachna vigintioctopunctata TaxID=420089 RepID=A0AAW1VDL8_9CUCU